MMTFLIMAPYSAYTTLMLVTSAGTSMFAAAAICLVAIGYDLWRGRSIKILGAGSALMFAALGFYIALVDSNWSNWAVRLAVGAGVLSIALGSLAIGRPFTQQYGREVVSPETARSPDFRRANDVITGAWVVACLAMAAANLLMIYLPVMPFWAGLAIGFAARFAAISFTARYRRRLNLARLPATGHPLTSPSVT